jgi:hypothetical protein
LTRHRALTCSGFASDRLRDPRGDDHSLGGRDRVQPPAREKARGATLQRNGRDIFGDDHGGAVRSTMIARIWSLIFILSLHGFGLRFLFDFDGAP